jgi:hypothetical protein
MMSHRQTDRRNGAQDQQATQHTLKPDQLQSHIVNASARRLPIQLQSGIVPD